VLIVEVTLLISIFLIYPISAQDDSIASLGPSAISLYIFNLKRIPVKAPLLRDSRGVNCNVYPCPVDVGP